jgi:hypothetical protein
MKEALEQVVELLPRVDENEASQIAGLLSYLPELQRPYKL